MKRSYPYTGPAASTQGQYVGPQVGPQQPAPSTTPSSADYSNYGYGAAAQQHQQQHHQQPAGQRALTSEEQQAQWHQQWQQYYAQQAAATAAQGSPVQQQQAQRPPQQQVYPAPYLQPQQAAPYYAQGPQQAAPYPTPAPPAAASYGTAYPAQPQTQPGYAGPQQRPQQPQTGYYGAQQQPIGPPAGIATPPAKRQRFEAGPGYAGGPQAPPHDAQWNQQHVGPSTSYGWQGAGGPTAGPHAPMRGGPPAQRGGRGGFAGPSVPGGSARPPPMQQAHNGSAHGSPAIRHPRGGASGLGGNAGRGGFNQASGGNPPRNGPQQFNAPSGPSAGSHANSNRRGGKAGPPHAGPSRSVSTATAGRPGSGFSSQNTIPTGGKNRFDQNRPPAGPSVKAATGMKAGKNAATTVNGSTVPASGKDNAQAGSDNTASAASKRTFTDFRITSIDIPLIEWGWSVRQEEEREEEKARLAQEAQEAAAAAEEEARREEEQKALEEDDDDNDSEEDELASDDDQEDEGDDEDRDASTVGDDAMSVAASQTGRPSSPIVPKGPKAGSNVGQQSGKNKSGKSGRQNKKETCRLRICFAAIAAAPPSNAPTGPSADRVPQGQKEDAQPAEQEQESSSDVPAVAADPEPAVPAQEPTLPKAEADPTNADLVKKEGEEESAVDATMEQLAADPATAEIKQEEASSDQLDSEHVDDTAGKAEDRSAAEGAEGEVPSATVAIKSEEVEESSAVDAETENDTKVVDPVPSSSTQDVALDLAASAPSIPSWSPFSKAAPQGSLNRISVSFAGTKRRLVIDAEVVKEMRVSRGEGKIEIVVALTTVSASSEGIEPAEEEKEYYLAKGLVVETRDRDSDHFVAITRPELEYAWEHETEYEAKPELSKKEQKKLKAERAAAAAASAAKTGGDAEMEGGKEGDDDQDVEEQEEVQHAPSGPYTSLPPLFRLPVTSSHSGEEQQELVITVSLDRLAPLAEPKWLKTGDVDEWLSTLPAFAGTLPSEQAWHDKINVVDPDPPPTIADVFAEWSTKSFLGTGRERRRFIQDYLSHAQGQVEILCRLVRGERASSISMMKDSSTGGNNPLAIATKKTPFASHQTHLSLAVLALFGLVEEYAGEAGVGGERVDARMGEILMSMPQNLVFKALDGLWKEVLDKKQRAQASTSSKTTSSALPRKPSNAPGTASGSQKRKAPATDDGSPRAGSPTMNGKASKKSKHRRNSKAGSATSREVLPVEGDTQASRAASTAAEEE